MKTSCLILTTLLFAQLAHGADVAGSGDHPLLPRYPGSEICAFESREYDEYRLVSGAAISRDEIPTVALEGRTTRNMYVLRDENRSPLEVMRNYQIALAEAGFQELYSCSEDDCAEGAPFKTYFFFRANPNLRLNCRLPDLADWSMPDSGPRYYSAKLERPGEGTVHVAVTVAAWKLRGGSGPRYLFVQADTVAAAPMQVGMELKLAADMDNELKSDGRAVLYGIQFDTDSAVLRPDSEATIAEIAALMQGQPALRLLVVGHTDNQGSLDHNLSLSKRRADAVVAALASDHGIAGNRLDPHGVAYLAPVASNASDAGRELNRRVELVEF